MSKNMKKPLLLITNLIILVNKMVIFDDGKSHLDNLLQKS